MADKQGDGVSASRSASFGGLLINGVTPTGAVLGRGSYGQVLEVDWHGTICAAKNVHDIFLDGVSPAESRRVISDFERECQTWSQLRHPNVVQLLGVYFKKDSSVPILVLEKMDTTLSGYLEQHSKEQFLILHKVSVLRQVAQALSYLHNQNLPLVHHDLSTNNILLCEWSFQAKITDFGMTRPISVAALTRRSSIKGTLAFMAPEALREPPRYDAKLDVFSYGNVIIATLTHQWPTPDAPNRYEGEQLVALNEFQRRGQHITLLSAAEKAQFLPIIQSSLNNRPERRPTSSELVAQVKRIEAALVQQVPDSKSSWPAMCADLRAERDALATERNALTAEKHKLEETVDHLDTSVATLETEKHKLEVTVEHLDTSVATLETEKHKLEETVDHLDTSVATLETEKHKLEVTVEHLDANVATLKTEKHKLEETLQHQNVIGGDLQKSVQQLDEASTILQVQIAQFQQDFAAVQLERQKLQQQLSAKKRTQDDTSQVSAMI